MGLAAGVEPASLRAYSQGALPGTRFRTEPRRLYPVELRQQSGSNLVIPILHCVSPQPRDQRFGVEQRFICGTFLPEQKPLVFEVLQGALNGPKIAPHPASNRRRAREGLLVPIPPMHQDVQQNDHFGRIDLKIVLMLQQ